MMNHTTATANLTGAIVAYAQPEAGETDLTFVVVEDNGDRLLIESRDFPDWRFPPREVVSRADVALVTA